MTLPAKALNPGQPALRLVANAAEGTAAGGTPLTLEHLAMLRDAEKRSKKIRRAAGVASFGGWSAAIFAVLSAAFAIFDPTSLLAAAALAFIAYHEFRGRAELLRFEPGAAKRLALNQLFFSALLVAYGGWNLYKGLTGASVLPASATTGDPEMDAMVAGITRNVTVVLYSGVIAIGVLVPGLTAWYYWSRRSIVENFLRRTPGWVVEAMRTRV